MSVAIAGSVSAPSLAVALALRPLIITLHWRLRCERCTVPVARPAALQQETRRPAKQFAADVALVGGVVAAGGRSVPASQPASQPVRKGQAGWLLQQPRRSRLRRGERYGRSRFTQWTTLSPPSPPTKRRLAHHSASRASWLARQCLLAQLAAAAALVPLCWLAKQAADIDKMLDSAHSRRLYRRVRSCSLSRSLARQAGRQTALAGLFECAITMFTIEPNQTCKVEQQTARFSLAIRVGELWMKNSQSLHLDARPANFKRQSSNRSSTNQSRPRVVALAFVGPIDRTSASSTSVESGALRVWPLPSV